MPVRRYRVEVAGRRLAVEVDLDAAGAAARVVVDGRPHALERRAAPSGAVSWLEGSASVLAHVEGGVPKLTVFCAGAEVPVTIEDARAAALAETAGKASGRASGPAAVRAPIPGRVVKLLVKAGDAVKAQQPVAVVEAMKMENELRAPREGRIDVVRVSEGAAVESGQELLVVV